MLFIEVIQPIEYRKREFPPGRRILVTSDSVPYFKKMYGSKIKVKDDQADTATFEELTKAKPKDKSEPTKPE
jgi:hypothetical protein